MADRKAIIPIERIGDTWNVPVVWVKLDPNDGFKDNVQAIFDLASPVSWITPELYKYFTEDRGKPETKIVDPHEYSSSTRQLPYLVVILDVKIGVEVIAFKVRFRQNLLVNETYRDVSCALGLDVFGQFKETVIDLGRNYLSLVPKNTNQWTVSLDPKVYT